MSDVTGQAAGWIPDGFQTMVALWGWTLLVLLHGLFRSFARSEPDAIRDSGPIDP